jgi:hypothetical protein
MVQLRHIPASVRLSGTKGCGFRGPISVAGDVSPQGIADARDNCKTLPPPGRLRGGEEPAEDGGKVSAAIPLLSQATKPKCGL